MSSKLSYKELESKVTQLEKELKNLKQDCQLMDERSKMYRNLVDLASDFIVILQDEKIKYANPSSKEVIGYLPGEMIDTPFGNYVFADQVEKVSEYYRRRIAGEQLEQRYESTLLHKDGQPVEVEVSGALVTYQKRPADLVILRDITERKAAVRQLKKDEEKYRFLIEKATDLIFITDKEGYIKFINKTVEKYGAIVEEFHGKNAVDFAQKDDVGRVLDLYNKLIKNPNETFYLENIKISYKGKTIHTDLITSYLPDTPNVNGVIVNCRDTTSRILAEEALKESEEKFRLVVENANEGIILIQDEKIVYANPRLVKFSPFEEGDIFSKKITELVHENDRDFLMKRLNAIAEGNSKPFQDQEYRFIDKRGKVRWLRTNSTLTKFKKRPAILAFLIEITREKETYKTLKKSEERFRLMAENMSDLVGLADENGDFTFVSPSYETVLGYPIDRLIGNPVLKFLHREDRPRILRKLEKSLRNKQPFFTEYRARHIDGFWLWLEASVRIIYSDEGEITGAVFNSRDITQRKQAQTDLLEAKAAAEYANNTKGNFLATMSHELRTPLNGVLGMTELLLTTQLDEQQRKYLENISFSGDALLKVLNDILDIARIEANKLELESIEFDISSTVTKNIQLFSGSAEIKGIQLNSIIPENIPKSLVGDPNRLGQVLTNIVANALKFTESGEIKVTLGVTSESKSEIIIRFEVSDTGIGISLENIDNIFNSFTQEDSSTTRKYGGTGLGLTISKSIVNLMNGQIGVESEPNVGSTFWFEIPFRKFEGDELDLITDIPLPEKSIKSEYGQILVVEDDPVGQAVISGMLSNLDYAADMVSNGKEAIESMTRNRYKLIFMDCLMPELDGLETTKKIREMEQNSDSDARATIVALTARAMKGDKEECLAAGMDDYLSKPLDIKDLRSVLEKYSNK